MGPQRSATYRAPLAREVCTEPTLLSSLFPHFVPTLPIRPSASGRSASSDMSIWNALRSWRAWDDFSSHTDRVNRRSRSYPGDKRCQLRVPNQRRGELASVLLARPLRCHAPHLTQLMHACSWGGTQPTVNYGGESAVHCGDHSPSPPFKAI
ncbi:hypothetical protein BGZ61DRAFT_443221 [Ilyonectria robusta]|uniref:uncharacterized protein n=1 Tax=Ilyonectria robusta TaxID=1079257 RepID=UPI001E8EBD22|nr:uncharacterized protein BGZ61DRAFT_443221 [Ilyonectria robusta]KAH8734837.1 hypothetical protein BGZ61DRAFT_443221 [Ilyonectria robusta]